MAFMAVRTLPKHTGLFGVVRDRATELLTEIEVGANYDLIGKPIALLMARFTVSSSAGASLVLTLPSIYLADTVLLLLVLHE
jgi:hypothetical protein